MNNLKDIMLYFRHWTKQLSWSYTYIVKKRKKSTKDETTAHSSQFFLSEYSRHWHRVVDRPASLGSLPGRYNIPLPESALSPSQGLRIWPQDFKCTAIAVETMHYAAPLAVEVFIINLSALSIIQYTPILSRLSSSRSKNKKRRPSL